MHSRTRFVVVLILGVLIPGVVVEAILRITIDVNFTRHAQGTIGLVFSPRIEGYPVNFPKGSPVAAFEGTRVQVVIDDADFMPEGWTLPSGAMHILDHRPIRFKVLDGDRKGDSVLLPNSAFRPDR
jgi:hypothetical protein